ncbi:MAG: glycosyltransferase family 4 protein [Chloroflexi bacterium]|nr:glycosyltransferase family 4 protein [Chloroflexota bacterium]MCL5025993.1 glycosyltransferase family 4 protein [Chloroflexota bacterium]
MRILMLCQYYPPVFGGVGRFVEDLSAELATRGHEVAVATLWDGQSPKLEVVRGVRVYRISGTIHRAAPLLFSHPGRKYAPPLPDPELLWAIRCIIARQRPQIVHAVDWLVHSFLPLKRWSRARLMVTLQDYFLVCVKWTLMYHQAVCSGPSLGKCMACGVRHFGLAKGVPTVLLSRVAGAAERAAVDMFAPVSQAVALGNDLAGGKVPFQVIPNFISDDLNCAHDAPRHYLEQLPGEGYLLFVGALAPSKGIDVLLRAYAGIADAPPLVLIGYEVAEYPLLSEKLPRNVIVLKNWPHHAVMSAWQRSLMGLVPSVWLEPFGLVMLEAFSASRPVIASQVGGLAEIVGESKAGLLVPPGDQLALRQAIERLLHDADLRERMGQAARQRVSEFRASTIVSRYEQAYQDLVNATDN